MKIKTRLVISFGLLFGLIVTLAVLGAKEINALSRDTRNILVANYSTLDYANKMMRALDEIEADTGMIETFRENLAKQQNNITEGGEQEATDRLTGHFNNLLKSPGSVYLQQLVRSDLYSLMLLNMHAIERKNKIADHTAASSTMWIAIAGTICFLIGFTLLMNLPAGVSRPILELTAAMEDIEQKNFSRRVKFSGGSEFTELADAFNSMASSLEESSKESMTGDIPAHHVSGIVNLSLRSTTPSQLLQFAIDSVKEIANERKVRILTQAPRDIPMIKADAEKTAWVLVHLLTKAVHTAPPGSEVTAEISVSKKHVYFSVDGAPDTAMVADTGLSLAKEIVEGQGGTWSTTHTAEENTFTISVPVV